MNAVVTLEHKWKLISAKQCQMLGVSQGLLQEQKTPKRARFCWSVRNLQLSFTNTDAVH